MLSALPLVSSQFWKTGAFSLQPLAFSLSQNPRSRFAIPPEALQQLETISFWRSKMVSESRHDSGIDAASARAHTLIHNASPIAAGEEFETIRLLCYITKGSKQKPYASRFTELLKGGLKPRYFSYLDISVLADQIQELLKTGDTKEIQELISLAKKFVPLINKEEIGSFAIIHLYQIAQLKQLGHSTRVRQAAQECLDFIEALPEVNGNELLLGTNGLNQIKAFAESQLAPDIPELPLQTQSLKKFERNERITVRYRDGTVMKDVKFKKVESDLKNGQCVLIEESESPTV